MKAKYVLCIVTMAMACAAQQPAGSGSLSGVQLSPAEADKLLVERVVPQYPEAGITNRIQNNELLSIRIDGQGNVAAAQVKSGHPAFAQASLDAVKQWKYQPYLVNGSPVPVETTALIAYRFYGPNDFSTPKEAFFSVVAMATAEGMPVESKPLQVGRNQLEELLTSRTEPQYPEEAKNKHIQGDVVIYIRIDKQGHVANLSPVSGNHMLVQAALDAVKQWTYKPFEVRGDAVEVESTVLVPFRIDNSTDKQQSEKQ